MKFNLCIISTKKAVNLFLTLNEFKRINRLLLHLKSSENQRFFDDFRGNKLICLNLLNIKFGSNPFETLSKAFKSLGVFIYIFIY